MIQGQDMAIRPVRRDEAASLREIRLRALGDAPPAYFASLESEEGLPLSYWEDWATSEDKVVFVAEEDGSWLGMAGAFVHPDKRGTVSLWWLWLAPSARHRSLADGWWTRGRTARERGAVRLELAVAENNGAAKRSTGAPALSRAEARGRWPRIEKKKKKKNRPL